MNQKYLDEKGIDLEKVKERQKQNHKKTIGETQMIPYVIMGIKAMNENMKNDKLQLLDRIERLEETLHNMNEAMYKTLERVDVIADQTNVKLESLQEQTMIQSISDDSFKETQERV